MSEEYFLDGQWMVEADNTTPSDAVFVGTLRDRNWKAPAGYYERLQKDFTQSWHWGRWRAGQLEREADAREKLTGSRFINLGKADESSGQL